MSSDIASTDLQKLRVFSKKQKALMWAAGVAAFALPHIPFPWQMNVFAIKDFLLTISVVLLGFVMASMSALLATKNTVDKKSYVHRVLTESPVNLYIVLIKGIRRLIVCIFINAAFGLLLILYAPECKNTIVEHRFWINIFSGFVLAPIAVCGCMIWLVAARFLRVMLNVGFNSNEAN